jgi:hypothetical protein
VFNTSNHKKRRLRTILIGCYSEVIRGTQEKNLEVTVPKHKEPINCSVTDQKEHQEEI